MNYKKYLAGLAALAILVALYYVTAFVRKEYGQPINNSNNTNTEQVNANSNSVPPSSNSNLKTYTSTQYDYSFSYPNILKPGSEDFTYLPYGNGSQRVAVDASYIHEINKEYCALSGECRPTTQDFGFNASVINSPLSDVQKSLGGSALPLQTKTFGSVHAIVTNQGVEGEGINYYFIAMPGNKTLMFSQRYIDENILVGYKGAKDFIPLAEQNKMMGEIISTLTFGK